jgi:hypothetical protein
VVRSAAHSRCYFNHPDGIAAVRAGTYGMRDGHRWVCTSPCNEAHAFPPAPHPEHRGEHERHAADVDYDVQQPLSPTDDDGYEDDGGPVRTQRRPAPAARADARKRTCNRAAGPSAAGKLLNRQRSLARSFRDSAGPASAGPECLKARRGRLPRRNSRPGAPLVRLSQRTEDPR